MKFFVSSRKLIPFQKAQLYFLARNTGVGTSTSPRDIYSVDMRVKSLPDQLKG